MLSASTPGVKPWGSRLDRLYTPAKKAQLSMLSLTSTKSHSPSTARGRNSRTNLHGFSRGYFARNAAAICRLSASPPRRMMGQASNRRLGRNAAARILLTQSILLRHRTGMNPSLIQCESPAAQRPKGVSSPDHGGGWGGGKRVNGHQEKRSERQLAMLPTTDRAPGSGYPTTRSARLSTDPRTSSSLRPGAALSGLLAPRFDSTVPKS